MANYSPKIAVKPHPKKEEFDGNIEVDFSSLPFRIGDVVTFDMTGISEGKYSVNIGSSKIIGKIILRVDNISENLSSINVNCNGHDDYMRTKVLKNPSKFIVLGGRVNPGLMSVDYNTAIHSSYISVRVDVDRFGNIRKNYKTIVSLPFAFMHRTGFRILDVKKFRVDAALDAQIANLRTNNYQENITNPEHYSITANAENLESSLSSICLPNPGNKSNVFRSFVSSFLRRKSLGLALDGVIHNEYDSATLEKHCKKCDNPLFSKNSLMYSKILVVNKKLYIHCISCNTRYEVLFDGDIIDKVIMDKTQAVKKKPAKKVPLDGEEDIDIEIDVPFGDYEDDEE